MYAKLASEYKVGLVPFMLAGVADKPNLFQQDRLHPTAQAHPAILANIWPQLKDLVKAQ
jgi:acyl-CoA thioesterase-1